MAASGVPGLHRLHGHLERPCGAASGITQGGLKKEGEGQGAQAQGQDAGRNAGLEDLGLIVSREGGGKLSPIPLEERGSTKAEARIGEGPGLFVGGNRRGGDAALSL